MSIRRLFFISISCFAFSISCMNTRTSYILLDDIIKRERTIAITSFTFPKSMTNEYYDKLKYLNTQIYADYVLNSFISNFNAQNTLIKLVTLENAIGSSDFSTLDNYYILGSSTVAATGTLATNTVDNKILSLLKENDIDGIMTANAIMSFWKQSIEVDFEVDSIDGSSLWVDSFIGNSQHIIGDTGSPTKQTSYKIIIADVLKYQERHLDDLYIIIDESVSNGISKLKNKVPYAFNTNNIIFTERTLSITNEDYSKKVGIDNGYN